MPWSKIRRITNRISSSRRHRQKPELYRTQLRPATPQTRSQHVQSETRRPGRNRRPRPTMVLVLPQTSPHTPTHMPETTKLGGARSNHVTTKTWKLPVRPRLSTTGQGLRQSTGGTSKAHVPSLWTQVYSTAGKT